MTSGENFNLSIPLGHTSVFIANSDPPPSGIDDKIPTGLEIVDGLRGSLTLRESSTDVSSSNNEPLVHDSNSWYRNTVVHFRNQISSNTEDIKNNIQKLPPELQPKARFLFLGLNEDKESFYDDARTNSQDKPVTLKAEGSLSKKEKQLLLPYSPLWTTPIEESLSKAETGLSDDYSTTTVPQNDGKGIVLRDDPESMNAWTTEVKRGGKRIYAALRCAAWIPTSSSWGSTLARQWTRLTTSIGLEKPPGETRLIDNMTSVLKLQLEDPDSKVSQNYNNDKGMGFSQDNPLTLSMLSNSLVSGCVMGGTDPEGYLQDMQLRLIKYANGRKEPFELKVKVNGKERSVWVKPDIMMLSSPVQSKDRWLMRWSCGLLGVRNHAANIETVKNLQKKLGAHKQEQLKKLQSLVGKGDHKAAFELALNIKANQELMDEIVEMRDSPGGLERGMYGDNYGNPHAFNARVNVLSERIGITPITNCKTGKDRTEDSEVAQKLLAAEIDEKIQSHLTNILQKLKKNQKREHNEHTLSALENELRAGLIRAIEGTDNTTTGSLSLSDVLETVITNEKLSLVPKRDFLSAGNLKKEIGSLNLSTNSQEAINSDIDSYSPGKPDQKDLYETIRGLFSDKDSIPSNLETLLTQFEQTAERRMAFSFSQAGFTIQMLNNKNLVWGNKQGRYPNYYFGFSSERIEAYAMLMKTTGRASN